MLSDCAPDQRSQRPLARCWAWIHDRRGGYDAVSEVRLTDREAVLRTYRCGEQLHRTDGPAYLYREAETESPDDLVCAYVLHGKVVGTAADQEHLDELVAAGADQEQVVGWLKVRDHPLALELAGKVSDPAQVADLVDAGLSGSEAILAVLRGHLPLSWALAGQGAS